MGFDVKELDSLRQGGRDWNPGQREKVREEALSVRGGDGFGVKLNPVNWKSPVAEGHDLLTSGPVARPGHGFQLLGEP